MSGRERIMTDVRRALRRSATSRSSPAPTPPPIDEPIVRLVQSDIGLAEQFARVARQNQMQVESVRADDLVERLIAALRAHECRRLALAAGGLLERLRLCEALCAAGFHARSWSRITSDELYDFDCGITDVRFAVAEVGALVIEGSQRHGRALSLVPPLHMAILEPRHLLPDLLDLFEHLARDPTPANTVIITGPSKTADIEMNLVTGVHGPGVVQVFVLA